MEDLPQIPQNKHICVITALWGKGKERKGERKGLLNPPSITFGALQMSTGTS